MISWNSRKRGKSRIKRILKSISDRYPTAFIGFQEAPRWETCKAGRFILRSDLKSDCDISVPTKFNAHLSNEEFGDYWYGLSVGDIIFISIHIVDHTIDGKGSKAMREALDFKTKVASQLHRKGLVHSVMLAYYNMQRLLQFYPSSILRLLNVVAGANDQKSTIRVRRMA